MKQLRIIGAILAVAALTVGLALVFVPRAGQSQSDRLARIIADLSWNGAALQQLQELGAEGRPAVPYLTALLEDPERSGTSIYRTLAAVGYPSDSLVALVAGRLAGRSSRGTLPTDLEWLAEQGLRAAAAAPAVENCMVGDGRVGRYAARTLLEIGGSRETVRDYLRGRLASYQHESSMLELLWTLLSAEERARVLAEEMFTSGNNSLMGAARSLVTRRSCPPELAAAAILEQLPKAAGESRRHLLEGLALCGPLPALREQVVAELLALPRDEGSQLHAILGALTAWEAPPEVCAELLAEALDATSFPRAPILEQVRELGVHAAPLRERLLALDEPEAALALLAIGDTTAARLRLFPGRDEALPARGPSAKACRAWIDACGFDARVEAALRSLLSWRSTDEPAQAARLLLEEGVIEVEVLRMIAASLVGGDRLRSDAFDDLFASIRRVGAESALVVPLVQVGYADRGVGSAIGLLRVLWRLGPAARCAAPFVAAFFDLDAGQRAELAAMCPDLPGARGEELMRTLQSPEHFREMRGIQRVRELAAAVLGRLGTPAVRALVTKSGAGVRPKSYASDVRSYPIDGPALEVLRDSVVSAERVCAAARLADDPGAHVLGALLAAAASAGAEVRAEAIRALAGRPAEATEELLLGRLADDHDATVRAACAEVLGGLSSEASLQALEHTLRDDPSGEVVGASVRALLLRGRVDLALEAAARPMQLVFPRSADAWLLLDTTGGWSVRATTWMPYYVRRVVHGQGVAALDALRTATRHTLPAVREAAAELIGWLGSEGQPAVEELRALCSDRRLAVRQAARRALRRIAGG